MKQKITELLNKFLEEKERLCESCTNYPEVHVFLPLELMSWEVDAWRLKPPEGRRKAKCIGHDHVVLLRCADRYKRSYTEAPSWRTLWKRHQNVLNQPASEVFILDHDDHLDELGDILDQAVQPGSSAVGLHVTQMPTDVEELCYELLESGLPLAVWQRRELSATAQGQDWSDLLSSCCLDKLPIRAKDERHSARRKPIEKHIGHHLSLLWDDPRLVPPKSA